MFKKPKVINTNNKRKLGKLYVLVAIFTAFKMSSIQLDDCNC